MNDSTLVDGLIRFEGKIPWMYLDTRGLVTVGIGNMLPSFEDAILLPFYLDDEPATRGQIAVAYHEVATMERGHLPEHYKLKPSVELTDGAIIELAAKRLQTEFVPGIKRTFNRFDKYPAPAQAALVDMAYNLGVSGLAKFQALAAACELGHWRTAAAECHRSTTRPDRNDWTRDQFLACAAAGDVS